MKKVISIIERLVTLKNDTYKHITGAVYVNWIAFILTAFLGAHVGVLALLVGVAIMLAWEVYQYNTKEEFSLAHSLKDVLAGVIVIAPQLLLLLKFF